jgi:glycosyltransferase involved in cell wall biosynthesis
MPHKSSKPLLSICIPTFNRADSLGLLLENISRECAPHLDRIEIVISDNASTDHTETVVKNRSDLPIAYSKNTKNLGGAGNLLTATAKIATGEFIWIIGDDDMILPGGIVRVLRSIIQNSEIDYHYINFGWIKASLRDHIIRSNDTRLVASLQTAFQCDLKEWRKLSKLEDLAFLPGGNPSALFCGIFCFAARRQFFVDALEWIKPTYCTDGSTIHLDDWYPHAMASIPPVIGKPIGYIGVPCMLQSIGAWEWKEYLSK